MTPTRVQSKPLRLNCVLLLLLIRPTDYRDDKEVRQEDRTFTSPKNSCAVKPSWPFMQPGSVIGGKALAVDVAASEKDQHFKLSLTLSQSFSS